MQHGLPMEADHAHLVARQFVLDQKIVDRIGVNFGNELLGLGQNARPVGAVGELRRGGHGFA